MRRILISVLAGVLALSSAAFSAVPAAADQSGPPVTYYLSVGDSLSVGWQPLPDGIPPGDPIPRGVTNQGYPNQLLTTLQASNPALQLVQLGCPGETTGTMLNGGGNCAAGYRSGVQLTDAVNFIKAHPGQIAYLTIDVGANDVVNCVSPAGVDAGCFRVGVSGIQANLGPILDTLRQAIRDSGNQRTTKAAGMTYYNPSLALWFANPALAKTTVGYQTLLNATETVKYLRAGFRVAPVASAFHTYDFRPSGNSPVPVNVATICLLTWACQLGDIHANEAGYGLIAATFAQTFRW